MLEYNNCMSFIRRFFYYSTSLVFRLLLLLVPVVFAVTLVFSNPGTITGALKGSGIYDQFIDLVLDASAKENNDQTAKDLLNDPEVRTIAKQAFTPELLERSSNDVVQGIYDWLNGKTPEPQFTLDLSSAKTTLLNGLSQYAEKRASGLPPCTAAQLQTLDLESDLLNLPCLPPGLTAKQVGDRFSEQLLTNADVLDKPVITNQTIADQNNGKSLTADVQNVPDTFQTAQDLRWVVMIPVVLLGLLLIFARRDRRAGLRHVSWALISVAAFLVIMLLAYWFVFNKVGSSLAKDDEVQVLVINGARVILNDLTTVMTWFAVGYAVVGAGTLLLLKYRFKAPEPIAVTDPSATLPEPEKPEPKPEKQK